MKCSEKTLNGSPCPMSTWGETSWCLGHAGKHGHEPAIEKLTLGRRIGGLKTAGQRRDALPAKLTEHGLDQGPPGWVAALGREYLHVVNSTVEPDKRAAVVVRIVGEIRSIVEAADLETRNKTLLAFITEHFPPAKHPELHRLLKVVK